MHFGYVPICGMGTSAYQLQRSIEANTIHGLSYTILYKKWAGMKARCFDKGHKQYPFYGGRGITVCKRWLDVRNFAKDMGMPPKGYTLERINNNKGYFPSNCRWATRAEQNRNKNSLRFMTINGKTKCASEWAREYGVEPYNVINRLKRGFTVEQALSPTDLRGVYITYAGRTMRLTEWAREVGMNPDKLAQRLKRNWPMERALSPQRKKGNQYGSS